MHLMLDPHSGRHVLHDARDLSSLSVVLPGAEDIPLPADAVPAGLGAVTADGTHVLLGCDALRALAGPLADDPAWQSRFVAMVAYAGRQGWLSPAGDAVQAHCTTAPCPCRLGSAATTGLSAPQPGRPSPST